MNRLLIWGTGKLAEHFIKNSFHGEIVGFVETHRTPGRTAFMGRPLYAGDEIPDVYDYIVIANSYATEVYNLCLKAGVDLSRLIFLRGVKGRVGCTETAVLKEILQEKNYSIYCGEFSLWEESFLREDARKYNELNRRENFKIQEKCMWPVTRDRYAQAGTMGNYFWQDLWAARKVRESGAKRHFDIGSRIDGFIAHLLAMGIDVSLIDIREFPGEVENLHTIIDDATMLKQLKDESIESMSALCSLEHFGLGRYGDPIDPEACFECFREIQKRIRKNGNLYLSLPIGKERLEFNAHRVFYAETIVESFSEMQLKEFSCAADNRIEKDVEIHKYDDDCHNGEYRYGLFHFIKR